MTFGAEKMSPSQAPQKPNDILLGFVASAMLCLLGALVIAKHRFRSVELSPKTALFVGSFFSALGLLLAFVAIWARFKRVSTDESKAQK